MTWGVDGVVYGLEPRIGAALDEPPSPLAGLAGVSFVALYGVAPARGPEKQLKFPYK